MRLRPSLRLALRERRRSCANFSTLLQFTTNINSIRLKLLLLVTQDRPKFGIWILASDVDLIRGAMMGLLTRRNTALTTSNGLKYFAKALRFDICTYWNSMPGRLRTATRDFTPQQECPAFSS
jgi:hypothetical protein